ncbi:MAG: hypothetical protein KKB70_08620, partial [Proteobacteria bacterium]|nr:hypothetical protein [Pseudomonadota bacterium]MBU1611190.1 hypothetical protein [Pseudomonadota bacterium]
WMERFAHSSGLGGKRMAGLFRGALARAEAKPLSWWNNMLFTDFLKLYFLLRDEHYYGFSTVTSD